MGRLRLNRRERLARDLVKLAALGGLLIGFGILAALRNDGATPAQPTASSAWRELHPPRPTTPMPLGNVAPSEPTSYAPLDAGSHHRHRRP